MQCLQFRGSIMGNVAVTFKVMPEGPEVDIEELKKEISKVIKIQDSRIEPIAFGLKALRILIITQDKGTEDIEKKIKGIKGIADIETESVTLI